MNKAFSRLKDFYFTIDLRSLGLFRILLSCVLIADWCCRWPNIEAFYTWFGVLPIDAPLPKAGGDFHFSLLDGLTSLPMVQLAFLLGLVCYLMLLVGYRTRFFKVAAFVFLVSVMNRNILIRDGSDIVLVTMFLWALFLPLEKRFSIDAIIEEMPNANPSKHNKRKEDEEKSPSVTSVAAFAIVLQFAMIYFFTALDKNGETWKNGTALYYALRFEQMSGPIGIAMSRLPIGFIHLMTWGSLSTEFLLPVLMMAPFGQPFFRRAAILGNCALQGSIWLFMSVGLFQPIMISLSVLLLSAEDWKLLGRRLLRWSRPVTVYYDDTCGFCFECCKLLSILDVAGYITLIGMRDKISFKHSIPPSELESSVVVFDDATQEKRMKSEGFSRIFRALPLPYHLFRLMALPGLRGKSDRVYDFVAKNRYRVSLWLGYKACGPGETIKPRTLPTPVTTPIRQAWMRFRRVFFEFAAALVLASILIETYNLNVAEDYKLARISNPMAMEAFIDSTQLIQDWHLFAPIPATDGGWWVVDGVTESGRPFDPLTGKPPTFLKPQDLTKQYDRFWRKYLYRLWLKDYADYRLYFGKYLTRKNHREKKTGERLSHFNFYYILETTLPPGSPEPFPTERIQLSYHNCFG